MIFASEVQCNSVIFFSLACRTAYCVTAEQNLVNSALQITNPTLYVQTLQK